MRPWDPKELLRRRTLQQLQRRSFSGANCSYQAGRLPGTKGPARYFPKAGALVTCNITSDSAMLDGVLRADGALMHKFAGGKPPLGQGNVTEDNGQHGGQALVSEMRSESHQDNSEVPTGLEPGPRVAPRTDVGRGFGTNQAPAETPASRSSRSRRPSLSAVTSADTDANAPETVCAAGCSVDRRGLEGQPHEHTSQRLVALTDPKRWPVRQTTCLKECVAEGDCVIENR